MKKLLMRALSLVAVMLFVANVSAATYKFTAPAPSGQTLSFEYVVGTDTAFVWVTCETQHASVHYSNASAYPNLSGHVIIPDSVEYNGAMHAVVAIGDLAFTRCENLAKITFSKHIKYIGYGAFYNCSGLDTIISPHITAPALNDYNPGWSNGWVFGGNANTSATVVVPCGSIEDYRSVWGNTFNYICENDNGSTDGGFNENGASYAVFSISENNRVHFSKGNLQFTTTGTHEVYGGGTATGTWRFAEHQYDYIGSANSNISSSYTGWIDLFGWGTSGWNSGANAYQPWAISENPADYTLGESYNNNMTGTYARSDWGVYNAISDGGNLPNMWRTLTNAEWGYLLKNRTASTVGETSNGRYAKATVAGGKGLIIFPDNYNHPAGVTVPVNVNISTATYTDNNYDATQWSLMETAGCVFLPAAGTRDGVSVSRMESDGYYWTTTHSTTSVHDYDVHSVYYNDFRLGNYGQDSRTRGLSVRLVMDESNNVSCTDINVSETQSICRGSFYDFFGSSLTESGVYTHTSTTADGCDSIVSLTLVVNDLPTVTINGEAIFDIGGSTTLTAEGGVSYIWNDGTTTPSITVDGCGTYSVTVTDFNGCINTTSITVTGVVHDTIVNIVHDTVRVCDTVYLPQYFYDTVYIHDTVYVIETGIHELKVVEAKVYVKSGRIIVDGAGVNMVYLFDSVGRMLATKQGNGETMEFMVPAAGVYMVKIGDGRPHKVVVMR